MSEKKKFELTSPVAIIVAGVIIAVAIIFTSARGAATPTTGTTGTTQTATVSKPTDADHLIGSLSAPIILIEYADLQCSFCTLIHPTLQKVVAESKGEIAWVYRHFPLYQIHPEAENAANASECVAEQTGNTGFWQFADTMFADQSKMNTAYYTQIAGLAGVNTTTFSACLANKKYQTKIDAQANEAMSAGAQGTPFVVVLNTKTGKTAVIPGALPEAQVKSVIESVK